MPNQLTLLTTIMTCLILCRPDAASSLTVPNLNIARHHHRPPSAPSSFTPHPPLPLLQRRTHQRHAVPRHNLPPHGRTTPDDDGDLNVGERGIQPPPHPPAHAQLPINKGGGGLGGFEPDKLPVRRQREVVVGDPQRKVAIEKYSVGAILKELAAIQQQGPQKYCILGTRHCSFLHQQIIELLSYALVLSENHVYTSGAMGTNAAAIRGALRAGRDDLLTVILPQSLSRQPNESQDLLREVTDLVTMPQNDGMDLDVASRLCNSRLLGETDQLVAFAFHESGTVIEAVEEGKKLDMLVTTLFLD